MRLINNSGSDRVIDLLRPHLKPGQQLDCVTPSFSLFAFAELREALAKLDRAHFISPPADDELDFLGGEGDRAARNRLQVRWLANECAKWFNGRVELRRAQGCVPQGAAVMRRSDGTADQVVMGSFAFSTDGLGLTPGNPLNLVQASESSGEAAQLALDLCVPIEQRTIHDKAVHAVGGGVLLACLSEKISATEVEALAEGIVAWHKALAPAGDTTCVFRDSAFTDDVAKTNMAAILQQHGIANGRSL